MTRSGDIQTHTTGIGLEIQYRVVASTRRRTLTLEVDDSGLTVRVPSRTRQRAVAELLEENSLWILRKLAQYEVEPATRERMGLANGSVLYLEGDSLTLRLVTANASFPVGDVRLSDGRINVAVFPDLAAADPESHVRLPLSAWYMQRAKRLLPRLATHYARRLGLTPPVVHIRDQKRRWGSCSARGEIRLNYRIIIPPPEVTRYIVAHEVCHLIELNHSPRFWDKVGMILPDYQRLRRLLRHWEPRMRL